MPDIRDQKLLYHLTALDNIESILQSGLLPRATLDRFADVANPEIIENRAAYGLDRFVPFHWFARNPFDGRVQQDYPNKKFVLITVRRAVAQGRNWSVVPRHPLANGAPELLDYQSGIAAIDWETMNRRDYHEAECKSICMAECLSPQPVPATEFFRIYAPDEEIARQVSNTINRLQLRLEVEVNSAMFL